MLNKISSEIKEILNNFTEEDAIIFNNKVIPINKNNFEEIKNSEEKIIAFIDGGQAEIISTGNFCLSFIRVFGQVFKKNEKLKSYKNEFYLFTKAKWINDELYYESKIYGDGINESDLLISSNDSSIKIGQERAPIAKVSNMARRFAELKLASEIEADVIVLDGTLEKTFKDEEKYLEKLEGNVCALAKSCSLFTINGNSPVILLNKIGGQECWSYLIEGKSYFVKLHQKAKHIFRFEGEKEKLSLLKENCNDALFLGYPYGLIFVDKMARISNVEKNSLRVKFLLSEENKELVKYLNSSNAHEILDRIG